MIQTKRNQEKVIVTKLCSYGKTKQKMKVGATKIQPDGSDQKGNQKRRLILKYNYSSGKMKQKM